MDMSCYFCSPILPDICQLKISVVSARHRAEVKCASQQCKNGPCWNNVLSVILLILLLSDRTDVGSWATGLGLPNKH